jgi:hypothetical protein
MTSWTTTTAPLSTTTVFLRPVNEIKQVHDMIRPKQHPPDDTGAETPTAEDVKYKMMGRLPSHFVGHSSPLPSVVVNLNSRRHTITAGSWQAPTFRNLIGTSECPIHPPRLQPGGHRYSVSLSWSRHRPCVEPYQSSIKSTVSARVRLPSLPNPR